MKPNKSMRLMHDPQQRDVVLDIIRRYRQRLSLVEERVRRGTQADPHLYRLALRAFGNWKGALKGASLNEPQIWAAQLPMFRQFPTRSSIVVAIRRKFDDGLPLNTSDIFAGSKADRALYRCAIRVMGSWANALRVAGIISKSEQRYRKRRFAYALDVITEIKRRHDGGLPIVYSGVAHKAHRDTALLASAKKIFGSWQSAVASAGFSVPTLATVRERIRRYSHPAGILAEIRRRHRQGLPLQHYHVAHRPHADNSLLRAAAQRFGSWVAAVEAAGFSYYKVCPRRHIPGRYPDPSAVIAAIRKRREAGQPLNLAAIQRSDRQLYKRAKIWYGGWRQAVAKAGIAYASVKLQTGRQSIYPTAESVVEAIHQRQTRGLPLNWAGLEQGQNRDIMLIKKGRQLFGNWRKAVQAAGIPYRSACCVRMTKKQIMARIRKRVT